MAEGELKNIIDYFKGRQDVSALYLFGRRKEPAGSPGREVGLGVLLGDEAMTRRRRAARKVGRGVLAHMDDDFVGWPVDVVLLNDAPAFLRHHIVRKGSVIFDRDLMHRLDFSQRAINEYLDAPASSGRMAEDAEGLAEMVEAALMKKLGG